MNAFVRTIDGFQELLAVCPCCNVLFRLVEAKFLFPRKRPQRCEYLDLVADESEVSAEESRITSAEQRFEERFESQREELMEHARRLAKMKLRKIDPTFSGRNIDPQDVRAIFHPIEYIIFHGLCSGGGVDFVNFVSRSPRSKKDEVIVKSIDAAVQAGYVVFETPHLEYDGSFVICEM
jgi:predicted Holliday junction resolvase-like endonuclease